MDKKTKVSVEDLARENAKNLIYQEENLEKEVTLDDQQVEIIGADDEVVERAIDKINPDENSMDSRG